MKKEMTWEEAMARIEEITALLESNTISLDESMKLFEEGTKLTAFCSKQLDTARQKITTLTKE
ncbi:MAG: exodeoxyribonuclease VII small subunit [Eubacteriales bacterium]|nr:exodeoxyribonuclease VII small subunit [Eubacteriales bacterium]